MCWGGREPFLPGPLTAGTQTGSSGMAEYRGKWETVRFTEEGRKIWSKFWKVLSSSITIITPRSLEQGLALAICTSSHRPRAPPAERCAAEVGQARPEVTASLLADSLVSLPLCKLASLEPRPFQLRPRKALKKPAPALRIGRRARLGSHTADRWDTRSCACRTWCR